MKKPFNISLLVASLLVSVTVFGQVGTITSTLPDTVCAGASGSLTITGYTAPIVRWEVSTNGGVSWSPTTNTNSSQSVFQIPNSTCYRVIHNGGSATSNIYCITVDQASNAGIISGGGAQCSVANGTMTVTGNNGTILGWYSSTGGAFGSLSNTTTSQAFTITQTTYYAFLTKNGVCPADTTFSTISIVPLSNAGLATSTSYTVCASGNSGTVSVPSLVGSNLGWQSSTNGITWNNTSNTTTNQSFSNLTQTTYYHIIAKNGICPADTSNNVMVQVDPVSVGGILNGGTYLCGAGPATGTLTLSGHTGTIVKWEQNTGSGWSLGSCSGATCAYSILGSVLYRVEVKSGVCPSAFSVYDTVTVSASSVAGTLTQSKDTLCALIGGGTLNLTGSTGTSYNWQFSTNGTTWINLSTSTSATTSYGNLPAGTYYFRCNVKNKLCPTATSNLVTVVAKPSPTVIILTQDTVIEQGQTITLIASGTGIPSWSPVTDLGSPTSFTTTATPVLPTHYVIVVADGSGCIGTDTVFVDMAIKSFSGFIANALTPNNDGINDELYVENIELFPDNSIKIINEYGQEVYSASPYKNNWKGTYDGNRLPDGTYYYVLTLKSSKKEYKGFITLLNGK